MKLSFFAFSLLAISSTSFAYNAQIEAGFTNFEHDNNFIDSNGQADVTGTYYFSPVLIKGPFNEATFLGHNSNVYADYSYNYVESQDISIQAGTASRDVTSHHFNAGLEYYLEKFYLNAELGFGQLEVEDRLAMPIGTLSNTAQEDIYTYRAVAGYMPMSNLLLATGTAGYQSDHEDNDDNRLLLKAKYVALLNTGQYINIEANALLGHTDNLVIATDYYFNSTFSAGLIYEIINNGQDNADLFTVRTKYFFQPNIAVGASAGFGDMTLLNINGTLHF